MPGFLSVNRVTLIGVVGRYGYELRATQTGTSVGHCTLTMSELGTNGQQYDTFVTCEMWGKVAEGVGDAGPGSVLYLEGALKRKKGREEGTWETIVNVAKCVVIERTVPERQGMRPVSMPVARQPVAAGRSDEPDDIPF